MPITTTYTCDRCAKQTPEPNQRPLTWPVINIGPAAMGCLCDTCWADFQVFMTELGHGDGYRTPPP